MVSSQPWPPAFSTSHPSALPISRWTGFAGSPTPTSAASATLAGIMGQADGDRLGSLEAGVRVGDTVTFNLSVTPPERDRTEVTGALIPHFDAAGTVIGYIAAIEDVTDRRRALDTLLRREEFVTSLLD